MEYEIINKNGVEVVLFKRLQELDFVRHGFSTRIGGTSQGRFNSMNLGVKTADAPENILENTKRFCQALGINFEDLVISDQVHESMIKVVDEKDKGKGFIRPRDYEGIDALITNVPGVPLITYYADCVPLLIADPMKRAVGLAHAGWQGTVLKIGKKTIEKMITEYGSRAEDILVVIGPSIGQCCYEVSENVIEKFNMNFTQHENFVISKGEGKYMLDLWEANQIALKEIGVLERNIIKSEICTACNLHQFYSHRKEADTGRMASVIQLI